MSKISNELLNFHQENGNNIKLVVNGDEFYHCYETENGYATVYDKTLGLFVYAKLLNGKYFSTKTPISKSPPIGLKKHLKESIIVKKNIFDLRYSLFHQSKINEPSILLDATYGPNNGLLSGRVLSRGNIRGLTIIVNFKDLQTTIPNESVERMLNGESYTENGNFCSVNEYFTLMSNGILNYRNDVVGPIELKHNREYYTTNLMMEEVMTKVSDLQDVNLENYDSQNEGIIDAINILYAGESQYRGNLWPHNSSINLQFGNVQTNLYLLTGIGRNERSMSIGTFCHENGHLLCRFPDLYDYGNRDGDNKQSEGLGQYCLMSSGNHNDNGRTPAPICSYLRDLVGWTTRLEINEVNTYTINPNDFTESYIFQTDKTNEYFIFENRIRSGLNSNLPSNGLAIFHCDTEGSNEWQDGNVHRHYQCRLLQADGRDDLERNINRGDEEDMFNESSGEVLSNTTNPSSKQWDGSDSGLRVRGVNIQNSVIQFEIFKEEV